MLRNFRRLNTFRKADCRRKNQKMPKKQKKTCSQTSGLNTTLASDMQLWYDEGDVVRNLTIAALLATLFLTAR